MLIRIRAGPGAKAKRRTRDAHGSAGILAATGAVTATLAVLILRCRRRPVSNAARLGREVFLASSGLPAAILDLAL